MSQKRDDRLLVTSLALANQLSASVVANATTSLIATAVELGSWGAAITTFAAGSAAVLPAIAIASIFGVAGIIQHKKGQEQAKGIADAIQQAAKDAKTGADLLRKLATGQMTLQVELDELVKHDLAEAVAIATQGRLQGDMKRVEERIEASLAQLSQEQLKALLSLREGQVNVEILAQAIDATTLEARDKITDVQAQTTAIREQLSQIAPAIEALLQRRAIPPGWVLVNEEFLATHRTELSDDEVLRFFDGRVPNWRYALSARIPPRQMVADLHEVLKKAIERARMQVTLLLGAGGEGKSTVLQQAVVQMVAANPTWKILWHEDVSRPLPRDWLPDASTIWVLVSDDADFIAGDAARVMKTLHNRGQSNVHFLLSARHTDWYAAKGDKQPWSAYCDFRSINLRGLSKHDAEMIVAAWGKLGSAGLGKLNAVAVEDAANRLVDAAKVESATTDGAFLGAMLRLRYGQDLEAHVLDLITRLDQRPLTGRCTSLARAFGYIVGPHAHNILTLSKPILSEAVGVAPRDLQANVLGPLGEEAAAVSSGPYILSRHRAIAESAMKILAGQFNVDFDEVFVDLVLAVPRQIARGDWVPSAGDWRYLPNRMFELGNHDLAVRLARAILTETPNNSFFRVNLARLLRESGDVDQAIEILSNPPEPPTGNRGYYREWGTAEGDRHNAALNLVLMAASLSDQVADTRPTPVDVAVALAGLAHSAADLFDKRGDRMFIDACGAAVRLAKRTEPTPRDLQFLRQNEARARRADVRDVHDERTALDRVLAAVDRAATELEIELPDWVPVEDELTYHQFARVLGVPPEGG